MPYINVKTNTSISKDMEIKIKSELGRAISVIPGKSESWLMVGIEAESVLYFDGDDSPAAMVEVSIFGKPNPPAFNDMTEMVCKILYSNLSIEPTRIYVKYTTTTDWGWNSSNF